MFRLRREPKVKAATADGARVYAVGDIHGRADLLEALLRQIDDDCRDHAGQVRLIFVGDYVDRGLQARAVIDRLIALERERYALTFLRGNHEAALLDFLSRPETGPYWFAIGGAETLYSYGLTAPATGASLDELKTASAAFKAALPDAHHEWLLRLELMARSGDYLFVHAGVRPGRPLEQQDERDLLEIREPFLKHRGALPYVVVHGHTPADRVVEDERRIGLDTGAYATGRLSAVRLEGALRHVLST